MATVRGDVSSDFEMGRLQRKRTDMNADDGGGTESVEGAIRPGIDLPDKEEDDGDETKERKGRKRRWRLASGCSSVDNLVLVGIVWCAVVAMMLVKWLWFYKWAIVSVEKALGPKTKSEAEPIVVSAVLVAPFVLTGLTYYAWRPEFRRMHRWRLSSPVHSLRIWRRYLVGSKLDSVDVAVIFVFVLVQVNTLVGKLLIDQYNGKIAKSGLLNRTGRALGMNGLYAVLLSIVFVARRSFVHDMLHLSSERAAQYHIWTGNFGVITLALHGLIYMYCWFAEGKLAESITPCFTCDAKRSYKSLRNFSGLAAQVFLTVVALASLERVRRKHFRRFTLVHCINVLFVASTCVHYYPAVFWFVPPVIVYIAYRVISVLTRSRHLALDAVALNNTFIHLKLRRSDIDAVFDHFMPGQYVYIKVDQINPYEWHPFSISSSPLDDPSSLSLEIKVHGPFTTRLLELVRSKSLTTVQVDGYYGTPIEITDNMVLIGGGSGITPFLAVLQDIWLKSLNPDACGGAKPRLPRRIWVVWTARDESILRAYKPLLQRIQDSDLWSAKILLYCTRSGGDDETIIQEAELISSASTTAVNEPDGGTPRFAASRGRVFGATATGVVLCMILAYLVGPFNSVWWFKRLWLLASCVVGALSGGSWVLRRHIQRRAGFERLDTVDIDQSVKMAKRGDPETVEKGTDAPGAICITPSRPNVDAILKQVHEEVRDSSSISYDIRVLISGPSPLHRRVVNACVSFRAPLMTVESRSFAL